MKKNKRTYLIGKDNRTKDELSYSKVSKYGNLKALNPVNNKTKDITNFGVLDVETLGLHAKPEAFIFGVLYTKNEVKVLYSVEEFKEELLKPKYSKMHIFAHNAEYDLNTIYDNIYELDSKALFNGAFIQATNGNCFFNDSMNIFQTSLRTLGELIGLPKLDLHKKFKSPTITPNFDFAKAVKKIKVSKKDIEYCIRDCEIVFESLVQIFTEVGAIKITQASLSMHIFRSKYIPKKIWYSERVEHFRKSYYGGRCEAFYIGEVDEGKVIDVNSMYPYAMVNCMFPDLLKLNYSPVVYAHDFPSYLKYYEGVAKVKVKHKNTEFGFLPYRIDGRLVFPVGIFEGYYNFNELRFAYEQKAIEFLSIRECYYAHRIESPFKDFINDHYNRRVESSHSFDKYRLKIYMNSLYGKFAENNIEEGEYIKDINSLEFKDKIKKANDKNIFVRIHMFSIDRNDCYLFTKPQHEKDKTYKIPLFSSYITSFSRVTLLQTMIEHKKHDVLYCDTDSIFFREMPNIIDSNLLGKWKIENKLITQISGLKNYSYKIKEKDGTFTEFNRIKGIPAKAHYDNESKTYTYLSLVRTKESIARNIKAGVQVERKKQLKHLYNKRIILDNGKTKPIQLND